MKKSKLQENSGKGGENEKSKNRRTTGEEKGVKREVFKTIGSSFLFSYQTFIPELLILACSFKNKHGLSY